MPSPTIATRCIGLMPNGRAIVGGAGLAFWSGTDWVRSETFASLGTVGVTSIDVLGQCAIAITGSFSANGTGASPFVAYQSGGCFARSYGVGINTTPLQLEFAPTVSADSGEVRLTGAQPGSSGILAVSALPDSTLTSLGTLLLSLSPTAPATLLPVTFSGAGSFIFPLDLHLPGMSGILACAQAAALTSAGAALSNGLQIGFCP